MPASAASALLTAGPVLVSGSSCTASIASNEGRLGADGTKALALRRTCGVLGREGRAGTACARLPVRLSSERTGDLELRKELEAWLASVDTWITVLDIAICLVDLGFIAFFLLLRLRDKAEEKARASPFTSRFRRRRRPRDAPPCGLRRPALARAKRR